MFGLKNKTENSCALIVDIGSSSVGMAIVESIPENDYGEIIWSHREYSLLRTSDSERSDKQIKTCVVNAFLEMGSQGLKVLHTYNSSLKIKEIRVSICAPWSRTTTKTINYGDEHPFNINDELIAEISKTAEEKTNEIVKEAEVENKGLSIIANKTIDIKVNGYLVQKVDNQEGREVEISHLTALAENQIIQTVSEAAEKVLPKASVELNSFMSVYYETLKNMHPDTSEICLVDVTAEATELGIVREGILKHTTHTDYGAFSLARDISNALNIPQEEAYSLIKNDSPLSETKISEEKKSEMQSVIEKYKLKTSSLFHETGDKLSIPKTIFLHCDLLTESFFTNQLKAGANEATDSDHAVHVVTSKLFNEEKPSDTAILLSAHYYHLINKGVIK